MTMKGPRADDNPLLLMLRRLTCRHEGEEHDYCGRCGADLRETAGYQCRLCDLRLKNRTFAPGQAPAFCPFCGAPRFTFKKIRKKKAAGR
ncbi:MAG: hypothetical protein AB1742_03720 [bacterium]